MQYKHMAAADVVSVLQLLQDENAAWQIMVPDADTIPKHLPFWEETGTEDEDDEDGDVYIANVIIGNKGVRMIFNDYASWCIAIMEDKSIGMFWVHDAHGAWERLQ